jgi:hypothetical protein
VWKNRVGRDFVTADFFKLERTCTKQTHDLVGQRVPLWYCECRLIGKGQGAVRRRIWSYLVLTRKRTVAVRALAKTGRQNGQNLEDFRRLDSMIAKDAQFRTFLPKLMTQISGGLSAEPELSFELQPWGGWISGSVATLGNYICSQMHGDKTRHGKPGGGLEGEKV